MLYHFELQMAGVILLTVMMAGGISLWLKRRREGRELDEAQKAAFVAGVNGNNNDGDHDADGYGGSYNNNSSRYTADADADAADSSSGDGEDSSDGNSVPPASARTDAAPDTKGGGLANP